MTYFCDKDIGHAPESAPDETEHELAIAVDREDGKDDKEGRIMAQGVERDGERDGEAKLMWSLSDAKERHEEPSEYDEKGSKGCKDEQRNEHKGYALGRDGGLGEKKGEVRLGEGKVGCVEATMLADAKQQQQQQQPSQSKQQQPKQQQSRSEPFLMDHRPSLLRIDEFRDEYVTDDFYMFGKLTKYYVSSTQLFVCSSC